MFCTKCGTQNSNGEKFCKNCGVLLDSSQPSQQPNNQDQQVQNNNGGLNQNYINQAVNPDMKIWAILSIVIPVVAIIWYTFIGLSFVIAMFIAAAGLACAKKGELSNKKLTKAGKIMNGILIGIAVLMFIIQLAKVLSK